MDRAPAATHLVSVEQLLSAAQRAAQVFGGHGQQPAAQPRHLLLLVSVELEQKLPGLQGGPASLQGLRKVVEPECGRRFERVELNLTEEM